jgi:hypothetical protein
MKRVLVITMLGCLMALSVNAQWSTNGDKVYYNGGNIGIGTSNPNYPLVVSHPTYSVTQSGTNYKIGTDIITQNTYSIAKNIRDNGYRMGLNIHTHIASSDFSGWLKAQYGVRIQHGVYNGSGPGTVENSYGLFLQGLDAGEATITNKYGIYQSGGSFINYFSGKVGIGTNTPSSLLEVNGSSLFLGKSLVKKQASDQTQNFVWFTDNALNPQGYLGHYDTDWFRLKTNESKMDFATGSSINMTLLDNGYVGIGTTNPEAKLDLSGGLSISGINDESSVNNFNNCIQLLNTNNAAIVYQPGTAEELMFGFHSNGNFYWGTGKNAGNNYSMMLSKNGNLKVFNAIGIGTTANLDNYKLSVNGKVRAERIDVVSDITSDFVFEDDYNLRTLEEVESFVKENKHLPEIPSAKDLEGQTYSVGEMDDLLLRKVEELTLYIIDLEKRMKQLEEENMELRDE